MGNYFSLFVNPEVLQDAGSKLSKLKLSPANLLPKEMMFVGSKAKSILKSMKRNDPVKAEFLNQTQKAFIACGEYLQKKMPLKNPVLRCFSSLDPNLRGSSWALKMMLQLKDRLTVIETEGQGDQFDLEMRRFHCDNSLLPLKDEEAIDVWWAELDPGKYPSAHKTGKGSSEQLPWSHGWVILQHHGRSDWPEEH